MTPPGRATETVAAVDVSATVTPGSAPLPLLKFPETVNVIEPVACAGSAALTVSVVPSSVSQATAGVSLAIVVPLRVTLPGAQNTTPAAP